MTASKPSRFLAKLALILVIFVFIGITAVAFFSAPMLEYIVPKVAKQYGVEIEQLKLTNPSLSQVNISKIQGSIRPQSIATRSATGVSAKLLEVDIENALINYDLRELLVSAWNGDLNKGSIDIDINQLTINQAGRTANSPHSGPASISRALVTGVNYTQFAVPFKSLTIDQFDYRYLRSSAKAPPFELTGMLSAQNNNERIHVILQTADFLLRSTSPPRRVPANQPQQRFRPTSPGTHPALLMGRQPSMQSRLHRFKASGTTKK